jgi:drug/metabolite transporter (DMT)-like permease
MTFAVAAILQQESAQLVSQEKSLSLRLLVDLLNRPRWLAGISCLIAGFGLQALALAYGPVALVQPIVITELAFAIPLAIWRRQRKAGTREWAGIICVVGGVSLFLWASSPVAGNANPGGAAWLAALVPVAAVSAATVVWGSTHHGPRRAMALGAAAGLCFGVLAVLTKSTTYLLSADGSQAFLHWQPYTAIAVGITALVVSQSAYQAGPLAYSMPFVGVLEPVVAVAIGETVLGEELRTSGAVLAVEGLAGAVAVTGIVLLTTSKTVLSIYQERKPAPSKANGTTGHENRRPLPAKGDRPRAGTTSDHPAYYTGRDGSNPSGARPPAAFTQNSVGPDSS